MMLLGDNKAKTLGIEVNFWKFAASSVAVLLAVSSVSIAGLLSFIGLAAPHMARRLTGSVHYKLLPLAAVIGATLASLCDTIARLLFNPMQLPCGIVTGLLGGIFFLALLMNRRGDAR